MAKKTFIVAHPKLCLKVEGSKKMARMEKGSEITLEEKDAKSLVKQGKILAVGVKKKVAVGTKPKDAESKAE